MATLTLNQLSLVFSLVLFLCISLSKETSSPPRPKSLILQLSKDSKTLQYFTTIHQRTPLVPLKLVVDLGGQFLWLGDCDTGYTSSTYKAAHCHSATCKLARAKFCNRCLAPPRPNCYNETCTLLPDNTVTQTASSGDVSMDVVSLQSTNGFNPGAVVVAPSFVFACGYAFTLDGLASGALGMIGLGRNKIAPPLQFASIFNFPKKFAICLSPSPASNGFVIFGDGPYALLPTNKDFSKSLTYTPLIFNRVSTASSYEKGEPSWEYFIGVNGIKINGEVVNFNTTKLAIDKAGYGGTKISSVNPYTAMETSIFKVFVDAYVKAAHKANGAAPSTAVAPFAACFNVKNGAASFPDVDLVLQSEGVVWSMSERDVMVRVSDGVKCLGFVDGGENPRTSIVVGARQIEDHLLQIDIANSRLGFTSSLLSQSTSCANFNFTSVA